LEFLAENLDFLEEVPLLDKNRIIFQQDGTGPHNARIVTIYLNQQFSGRWLGRYGPIHWPARFPDLNPLDFFLWGYCKEVIYRRLPENIEELNDRFIMLFGHYASGWMPFLLIISMAAKALKLVRVRSLSPEQNFLEEGKRKHES